MNAAPKDLAAGEIAPVVTIWRDNTGKDITAARAMNLAELERVIRAAHPAPAKDELALLKLASFGTVTTAKKCLRHDKNVLQVHGVEGDYDGEVVPMSQAAEALSAAGVAAVLYSSASHTPERPRWRVLVPLSAPLHGTEEQLREQRRHWTGVVNALLGGVLKGESFVLSQSYYFGRVQGQAEPEIIRLSGLCIDQMEDPATPVFSTSSSKPRKESKGRTDDGVREDRSADLLARVGADVRRDLADYQIHALHAQHPHVLDQPDPARAIQRAIDKARADAAADDARKQNPSAGPTPLVRTLPPPAAYPVDALGPVLGPAARAIAEIVQVPFALAANSVLATAALAAQSHFNVQTLGGARPLSLFVLSVAGSGDRKSTSDTIALAPVHEHVRRLTMTYEAEVAEHERAVASVKLARQKARKAAETPDAYAEALKEISQEPAPRRPWIVCTEPTAEGLLLSLRDGQLAQGIFTDEGGTFIGGHAMTQEAQLRTISMLSRAWSGDPLDRVRAKDLEHTILYGRRLSMHLLAQPDVAAFLLGSSLYRNQGILARWLIAAPESLAGTRAHDPARPIARDDPRILRYYHTLNELLTRTPNEDRDVGGLDPACLALAPDARVRLVAAYNELESAQRVGGPLELVREWAGKAAEHACRIAGVLALLTDPAATHVLPDTMSDALELTRHYLSEYERLVGSAGVSEEISRAHTLLEWIRRKQLRTVTPRYIMQFGPSAIRSADVARAALQTLVAHHWCQTEDNRTYAVHAAALTTD